MQADVTAALDIDIRHSVPDFELRVKASLPLHGTTGLFGPSGSGKSTLLRIVAGLERDAQGTVSAYGECWADSANRICQPAYARPVGYLFQDARLFSHLDVRGNLDFAARRNAGGGPNLDEVVDALKLGPLMQRDCTRLSGGERQRVALGRTLLCDPRLLLLDEPLAALDATRKNEIIPYLESLPERFGIPAVYVSHAVDEIVQLASQVLVLEEGEVRAFGETATVLNSLQPAAPGGAPVASVLDAVFVQHLPSLQLTELRCSGQELFIPQQDNLKPGEHVRLRVRAGDVAIATSAPQDISIRNVLSGTLQSIATDASGPFAIAAIDIDGSVLRCQLTRQAVDELQLQPGMPVFALLKTAAFDERA